MDKIKQGIAPGLWGAALGAVALAIVGFSWGGWVTGSTADEMARVAVVDRLVPICVAQFNGDAEKVMRLAEIKKTDSWKQVEFVTKQGWATMPGAKEANYNVAQGCATKITS